MKISLPYGEPRLAAELPDDTVLLSTIERSSRVIVAAPRDAHVPRHLSFEMADSVEEAVTHARHIHGPGATIAYVAHPPVTR